MNSFKFVADGIEAEAARQIGLYEAGEEVVQETLHFDPSTGRVQIREVNVDSHSYKVAREYMIRLDPADLDDAGTLAALAEEAGTSPEEFRSRYAARAGIEGTHEQANRLCGLRRCRYIGEAKAHLQHLLTAVALNVVRLSEWWAGTPLARMLAWSLSVWFATTPSRVTLPFSMMMWIGGTACKA